MLEELSKEELILTIKELKEDNSKLITENNELKKVVNKVSKLLSNNKEEITKMFAVNTAVTNIEDTISVKVNKVGDSIRNVKTTVKLIDLGLPSGTLWMDRNIGAKYPIDFGLYFAWGETKGYTSDEVGKTKQFIWKDYKYCNGNDDKLTKYCNKSNYGDNGYTDSLVTLQTTDDAVLQSIHKCSMPTKEQLQELIDNTTYKWTTQDGVNGGLFTSKINDNSIFVPAAGYCVNGSVNVVGVNGLLWSSSLYEDGPDDAWGLGFFSEGVVCNYNSRYYGFSVRGVVKV